MPIRVTKHLQAKIVRDDMYSDLYVKIYSDNVLSGKNTINYSEWGDMDNDKNITLNDTLLALKLALGLIDNNLFNKNSADMDLDGIITLNDVLIELKISLGICEKTIFA